MKKLQDLSPAVKLAAIAILSLLCYICMNSESFAFLGYISMFAALFVIFEGFGLQLVYKILIGLGLGLGLALISIQFGIFRPEDLVAVQPVGSKIFMNCLTMALVPLVFCSILTGVTNLGDIKRLNAIGMRTISYYILTTVVAIVIGLALANTFQPGRNISAETQVKFKQVFSEQAQTKVVKAQEDRQTLFEGLQSIFPKNIFDSIGKAKPDMLPLIFFALICGIALLQLEPKYADPVIGVCQGITEMTVKIVIMVMRLAPYGVFALIVSVVASTKSTEFIQSLVPFSLLVLAGLALHVVFISLFSVKLLSKRNVKDFLSKMRPVAVTAFSTASSAGTMPITLEVAEEDMGVRREIAGFVIPLGATVNMDGTALFQGISAIFLANIYGIDLGLVDQLTVLAMTVMASIGTAAVPGVGIVILTLVLVSVGIPAEGILFILPVNNILDMFRTTVNVTGDMAASIYIDTKDRRARGETIAA